MTGKQLTMSFLGTIIRGALLVIAVLVIYKAGMKAYDFGFRIFTEEPMSEAPGRDIEITVSDGDGTKAVSKMLEEKGLIRDAQLFMIQAKLSEYSGDIQPGNYTLNTSMTAEEMLAVLLTDESADAEEETDETDELQEADPLTEAAPADDTGDATEDSVTAEDTETTEN
ncbi:MAG TPA: endolytic transglycosylase MltG [Lachnospiraceae bacterium]|nr:endolytic transglycosylase MltG [Lachnospiraceae bacterium]